MLKLTKRADYGMMAMRYLAERADDGRTHSARDIGDAYNIPLPVLAKTPQALAKADLVASQHGAMGGYALARPASAISTLEVIAVFDGTPVITSLRDRPRNMRDGASLHHKGTVAASERKHPGVAAQHHGCRPYRSGRELSHTRR